MSDENLKHTPLESAHLRLGAKMVPFAGWYMPVQYSSIIQEHQAVRQHVGIFDISHMGQFIVRGEAACDWLNGLLTNNLARLAVGEGQYTLMLNAAGGVIDDLIAYRSEEHEFFLVVNASRIDEDFAWLSQHLKDGITLINESEAWAGMAIQGPQARQIFIHALPASTLPPRNGIARSSCGGTVICRTGYTGEDGFEFFCPVSEAIARWDAFVAAGAVPCGLGSRDTLRLEMGYPLNGNDLSPERTPIEAGLGFFCALEDGIDYIGREVLLRQKAEGTTHKLTALQLTAGGPPPRAHYPVLTADGTLIGELCSGALSPSLKTGIGMAYLPVAHARIGTPLLIDVRGRTFSAEVVKKPFYSKTNPSILAHP